MLQNITRFLGKKNFDLLKGSIRSHIIIFGTIFLDLVLLGISSIMLYIIDNTLIARLKFQLISEIMVTTIQVLYTLATVGLVACYTFFDLMKTIKILKDEMITKKKYQPSNRTTKVSKVVKPNKNKGGSNRRR